MCDTAAAGTRIVSYIYTSMILLLFSCHNDDIYVLVQVQTGTQEKLGVDSQAAFTPQQLKRSNTAALYLIYKPQYYPQQQQQP